MMLCGRAATGAAAVVVYDCCHSSRKSSLETELKIEKKKNTPVTHDAQRLESPIHSCCPWVH